MRNNLVSVCILTYNHEQYLKECIESILRQETKFEFEIIIADDCSSDKSGDIMQHYKNKYPEQIKLIFQERNIGVIRNLTSLLKKAGAKYVAICESDDYWIDKDKLQKQVEILENYPEYSMVCSNRMILGPDGTIFEDSGYKKDIYTIADVIEGFIPGTQTMIFRNYSSLEDYFIKYQHVFSGDRYLSYFCSLMGDIYRMSDFTAVYRITARGVWSRNSQIQKLRHLNDDMITFHQSLGIPLNNEILAASSFNNSMVLLTYIIKRPRMLFKRKNWRFIVKPIAVFSKMNRIKFLCSAAIKRFKRN